MTQIKKILYATDLTKNSAYAFYHAVDLARKYGASIVVLHAIERISPMVVEAGPQFAEMAREGKKRERETDVEEIRKNIREFCNRMETHLGSPCVQLVSEILVPVGYVVDEILKAADDENCDVIVLGTHGKGILRYTFLGSVAVSVLERTRKPVFIIPLPSEERDIGWDRI